MLGNPHGHTTSGDNSSESGSHKKSRSELEVIDIKLKKCTSEIESMKKKQQSKLSLRLEIFSQNIGVAKTNL